MHVKHRRIARLMAAVVLVSAAAIVPATAGPWREQPHAKPSGTSEFLYDTIALSRKDAYAAGYRYAIVGGTIEFRTVALHWDGLSWEQMSTIDVESAPARNFLRGIGGTSSEDLWIVGWYLPASGPGHTLIEHWNGEAWSIVDTPPSPPGGAFLYKVAAGSTTDAWAVGHTYDGLLGEQPLALHWNGGDWSSVTVPAIPGCLKNSQLTDVAMRPDGIAWASGWCLAAEGRAQGYVLRWNGSDWRVVVGRKKLEGSTRLAGVAIVGSEVWAVGERAFDGSKTEPVVLQFDRAGGWKERPVPTELVGRYPALLAVSGRFPDHVWAVGETNHPDAPGLTNPLTLRWDGESWTRAPAGEAMKLFGVDVTLNGRAFAVGLYQQKDDAVIQTRRDTPE